MVKHSMSCTSTSLLKMMMLWVTIIPTTFAFVVFPSSKPITNHHWTNNNNIKLSSSSLTRSSRSSSSSSSRSLLFSKTTTTTTTTTNKDNNDVIIFPFVIEELSQFQASKASADIADLVIKVFFEEEAELNIENRSQMSPWKAMQLAYLNNLQKGDVKGKKFLLSKNINNSMFVARQIIPCYGNNNVKKDEKVNVFNDVNNDDDDDFDGSKFKVYNKEYLPKDTKLFKKGPILGFVDVSEKTFGLASDSKKSVQLGDNSEEKSDEDSPINKRSLRPVLTNLSVKEEARRSGVGSALVDACENVVRSSWSKTYNEMVLEVEEENSLAQRFYEKRGYVALYADPSSRRYDTSGIILGETRTTKIAYRKEFKSSWLDSSTKNTTGGLFNFPFFANIKEAISAK